MSDKPYDLLVISDCVLDIYYRINKLPINANDLVIADSMAVSPGGSCNVAVVARRLGLNVAVMDKVGNDEFGELLINELRAIEVDAGFIRRCPGVTTVSINIISDDGTHAFLGYPGVNVNLTVHDINTDAFNMAKAIYIGGFNASISERAANELLRIINLAKDKAPVFLDVGPATGNLNLIMRMINESATVFMNKHEAERLFNKPLNEAINLMSRLNVNFVIKLGDEGAVIIHGNEVKRCGAYRQSKVVTTVGAGEAFNAAYIAGVLKGLDPVMACNLGNRVASIRLSYLTPMELPMLMDLLNNLS